MNKPEPVMMDGNEAAATVAHLLNEVIAIYPITPASPAGRYADAWSVAGRKNLWGTVPASLKCRVKGCCRLRFMVHCRQVGLTTTFTASQRVFLLMLPDIIKLPGELTSGVSRNSSLRSRPGALHFL